MCIGLLAHVDAGKTTLSEALLYCAGSIRHLGRVDHGDAFLDTFALERQRGITIFSKQAVLETDALRATLLDTPGHVDFSAEMERTLSVLDCAILVVSAPAGVQSHTRTLWKLLRRRNIPTFLFVNKLDLPCPDRTELLEELRRTLGDGIVDMENPDPEAMALGSEALLEEYLETGAVSEASLAQAVAQGKLFPCAFGAALKLTGVEAFLSLLTRLAPAAPAKPDFGALVYKISRDDQGVRLSHMKLTGGALRVRSTPGPSSRPWRRPAPATWWPPWASPPPGPARVWAARPSPWPRRWSRCCATGRLCRRTATRSRPWPSSASWKKKTPSSTWTGTASAAPYSCG